MHLVSVEGSAEKRAPQHWDESGHSPMQPLSQELPRRWHAVWPVCWLCRRRACLVVVLCVCKQASALASPGHVLAFERCFLGWGVHQRELQVERARTLAEPPEKPGGIGALGMASCTSHRVQLVARSLTHSITHSLTHSLTHSHTYVYIHM